MVRLRRLGKSVALALLPLAVLLLLLEVGLRLAGCGTLVSLPAASRGFDPADPLLVADGEGDGVTRTRLFDGAEHEVVVPPRGTQRRVLLFGGSNTRLLPGAYLETLLDRRAPDPGYEVINLGRHGFGSGRVLNLLRQALVLEPDVVVINCGHNELVEEQFSTEVEPSPEGPAGLASQLRQLKTAEVLADQLRKVAREQVPEGRQGLSPEAHFAHHSWEQIHACYERQGENLREMCRTAAAAGVTVILCTPVANLLCPPHLGTPAPGTPEPAASSSAALCAQALALLPARCTDALFPHPRVHVYDWGLKTNEWWEEFYTPPAAEQPFAAPMPALNPELLAAARRGLADWPEPPLADGALWTLPSTWSERLRRVMVTASAIRERRLDEAERTRVLAAAALLDEALALVPQHPDALHALGLCTWLLGGDDPRAIALFTEAERYDRAPSRGPEFVNENFRAVAREFPEVRFFDAARWFAERAADGLTDFQLVMDTNHLQPGARLILLQEVAELVLAGER